MEKSICEGVDFTDANVEYYNHIFTISYSPDGLHVASGGDSKKITVWDTKSGKMLSPMLVMIFQYKRLFLAH